MFEQMKVMKKIYQKGLPTPYSLEEMIKCVIELEDIEAICLFLKANKDLPSIYVKILLESAIDLYKTGYENYFEDLIKLCSKMNDKTKKEISDNVLIINSILDKYYTYHRGYDF